MKHYIIYVVLADVVGKIGEVENSAFECINQHLKEMIESKEGRTKRRVKVSASVEVYYCCCKFYRVKGSTVQ